MGRTHAVESLIRRERGSGGARRLAIVVGAGLLAVAFVGPTATSAVAPVRDLAALDAQVSKLERAGASQAAIDAVFQRSGLRRVQSAVENELLALSSVKSDVALSQPSVYWDDRFGQWAVRGKFQWNHNCQSGVYPNNVYPKNSCSYKDCTIFDPPKNCGGPDGFGVRVNREVNEARTAFYTYDLAGYQTTWTYPQEMNGYGASWVEQDKIRNTATLQSAYTWDAGTVYYFFWSTPGCTRGTAYKAYSTLSHTWESTSVTGFGIGGGSFSISWNGNPHHWEATNATPTTFYPCG